MQQITQEVIESFCKETLGDCDYIEMLAGDASTRQYFRVQCSHNTYIVCHDPSFVGCNLNLYPFYQVHKLFCKYNVPVPKVYRYDAVHGLILQEDCGDFLAEDFVKEVTSNHLTSQYERFIDTIFLIQSIKNDGSIPFSLFFDEEKLMFEFNFFITHAFEGFFNASCNEKVKQELISHFCAVAAKLQRKEFFVLCHRDFHSRNILITDQNFYIIDFQDARMGLPLYDVVSLLRDSYVILPEDVFSYLKEYYYVQSRNRKIHSMSKDEFENLFLLSAFQRNVKALGTFGYQINQRKKHIYIPYVNNTLEYLKKYADLPSSVSRPSQLILECIGF